MHLTAHAHLRQGVIEVGGGGGNKVARKACCHLGACPPLPGFFEIRYSEVILVGFGVAFSHFVILKWESDSKGVKIEFVGLYFSMYTSQQNMCALRL